ncbi:hypothetical protein [Actinoallomurus rhizosphaericola]|uniref:hypothetical protein n=1 Tax=Actinoallomurus rhizosphaericola TaxID=2952536 RepID=UPI002093A625|nr:hypothetical protein [Actinoallomurus rhizosphaericola]MCO5996165.1 hypothetical protein [Actinoallomurus rhizosphaericola]
MGDPGLPIMAGALAVPVAVLLLVLVFALMGRRWVLTGPDVAFEDDAAAYEDDDFEPTPYRAALEPPRPASPAAYDAYRPSTPGYGFAPAAHDPYGPGRDPYATPPRDPYDRTAREPYDSPAPEPYAPPQRAEVSDWEPYVPAPRRSPEPASRPSYGAPADPYGQGDPYAASADDPYGARGRSPFESPEWQRKNPRPVRTDHLDPSAYPDPGHREPEDRQRFPYDPYDAR